MSTKRIELRVAAMMLFIMVALLLVMMAQGPKQDESLASKTKDIYAMPVL